MDDCPARPAGGQADSAAGARARFALNAPVSLPSNLAMRNLVWLILLITLPRQVVAAPGHTIFPEAEAVDGQRELVATMIKLPAREALALLWGNPRELTPGIDRLLQRSIAEPLETVRAQTAIGDEIDISQGSEMPFPQLWASPRRFGQAPIVEVDGSANRLVGTRCFTKDGGFRLDHDLCAPRRWVWQNGEFWGGSEFAFLQRSVFSLEMASLPVGVSGLVAAAEWAPGTSPVSPLETCLMFARHSAAADEETRPADIDAMVRFDLVTFASSDWTVISRLLLRDGPSDDEDLFESLRDRLDNGKSEIRALHSLVARDGDRTKLKSQLRHRHPAGLEPMGGTDNQARRYVPTSFRAVPETIGMTEFGSSLVLEFHLDGKTCGTSISMESTLEPPFETLMKTDPARSTSEDPAAIAAIQGYQLDFSNHYQLRLGRTTLILAHRPSGLRPAEQREGEWQITFIRASKPF